MQVRTTVLEKRHICLRWRKYFFIHVIMDTSTSTEVKLRLHFPCFKRINDIRKGL